VYVTDADGVGRLREPEGVRETPGVGEGVALAVRVPVGEKLFVWDWVGGLGVNVGEGVSRRE